MRPHDEDAEFWGKVIAVAIIVLSAISKIFKATRQSITIDLRIITITFSIGQPKCDGEGRERIVSYGEKSNRQETKGTVEGSGKSA